MGHGCSSIVNTLYGEVFNSDIDDGYSPNSFGTSRNVSVASLSGVLTDSDLADTLDQISKCSGDTIVDEIERESRGIADIMPPFEMHVLPVPSGSPRALFPIVQGGASRSCGCVSQACSQVFSDGVCLSTSNGNVHRDGTGTIDSDSCHPHRLSWVAGGAGGKKRQRSPVLSDVSQAEEAAEAAEALAMDGVLPDHHPDDHFDFPDFSTDIVWPAWHYAALPGEELQTIHVSVGSSEPTAVQVPAC
eukprot:6489789-Amphidinium_carterae.1